MLFVALNVNLAAYLERVPDGDISTTEALAPRFPKPHLCRVSILELVIVSLTVTKVYNLP